MTTPADDEVLTAHEAAKALKVHYKTVLIYVRTGELKAVKRRNRLFIRQSWLDEFLALDADAA